MTNVKLLTGIVAIPVTAFDNQLNIDEKSTKRQIDFIVRSGVQGILANVNASEWHTLSDEERLRLAEMIVGEVAGQLPVFIGVTAQSLPASIAFARHAERIGATGVNSMPPPLLQLDTAGCVEFYKQLSHAVTVPVILQNFYPPIGTPMSPEPIARLAQDIDNLRYVKEETLPEPIKLSAVLSVLEGTNAVDGVFGGQGGIYLIDELERGVSGNMPACHIGDVLSRVWSAWTTGNTEAARQLHSRLLPLMTFERCYGGTSVYKEVLLRRQVITCARTRSLTSGLDRFALNHLGHILSDIDDLLPAYS
jgi:dihydrodipicolinate synthase/N-acetylneuraminate lyase